MIKQLLSFTFLTAIAMNLSCMEPQFHFPIKDGCETDELGSEEEGHQDETLNELQTLASRNKQQEIISLIETNDWILTTPDSWLFLKELICVYNLDKVVKHLSTNLGKLDGDELADYLGERDKSKLLGILYPNIETFEDVTALIDETFSMKVVCNLFAIVCKKNHRNNTGDLVLSCLISNGCFKPALILINNLDNLEISLKDADGHTALYHAVQKLFELNQKKPEFGQNDNLLEECEVRPELISLTKTISSLEDVIATLLSRGLGWDDGVDENNTPRAKMIEHGLDHLIDQLNNRKPIRNKRFFFGKVKNSSISNKQIARGIFAVGIIALVGLWLYDKFSNNNSDK